jgi:hypothetical protein
MPRAFDRWWIGVCAFAVTLAVTLLALRPDRHVRTEDHNRDGRPDVWRIYDRHGLLTRAAFDTNFDGRSDVQEYYEHGALVRRESDRDFNDRVDLIQEFDARTSESRRSVIDVDFDGTADLLILFQDGRPVFTKWAHARAATAAAVPVRTADDQLASLTDPFLADPAIKALNSAADDRDSVESSTSSGLSPPAPRFSNPLTALQVRVDPRAAPPAASPVNRASPRGPPPHQPV